MLVRIGILALAALMGGAAAAMSDLATLTKARWLDPDAMRPRAAMERFWTEHPLPTPLNAADVPLFPADAKTLNLPATSDAPLITVVTLLPGAFLGIAPAREPRSGERYPRVLGVYARNGDTLTLRFRVYFANDEMVDRATQVGRWLGALSAMSGRLLGPASQARYPLSVWLSPAGLPGAQTWNGSIILHGASAGRGGLEWARQLTHEWGHAAIPGGGGFTAPEAWAAGDLGERLFLPAMQAAGLLAAWGEPLDIAAYADRYVDPPRAAFARSGPVPRLVKGTGADAYDHYIGAALYIAAAYGMPLLSETLNDLDGPRTSDLLAAFHRVLAARKEWTVARITDEEGKAAVCFPTRGRYMLEAHTPKETSVPSGRPRIFAPGWALMNWRGTLDVRPLPEAGKG